MNQDFMDPEIFSDFIIESREHLESIEPNLLELEKAPGNLDLLNEIFRPMHSLKGASGFMGLNKINVLAHRSENILDELRKGTMNVSSDIMDVILSATDALRQMIDNLESSGVEGDVDTTAIVETLDALMAGGGVLAAAPAPAAPPEASTQAASAPAVNEAPPAPEPVVETVVEAVAEPAPAPAPTPIADDLPADKQAWLDSLTKLPTYKLTAFGEAHLKDFIDESIEIIAELNNGLLKLEGGGSASEDLVNDLFRYFHNLKGNSGIIGYSELNRLTHEAETLLNFVRKGEMQISTDLVDLLLITVDMLDSLIACINTTEGSATPYNVKTLEEKLEKASSGQGVEMPFHKEGSAPAEKAVAEAAPAETLQVIDSELSEDLEVFNSTMAQQKQTIAEALQELEKDGLQQEYVDALYRSLTTIQNSCNYMGFEEAKVYATITAGIVDQGRKTGLDFSMMVDMMGQETAILYELIDKALANLSPAATSAAPEAKAQPAPAAPASSPAEPKPVAEAKPQASAVAPETKPEVAAPVAATPTPPASEAAAPAAPAAAKPASAPAPASPASPATPATPAASPAAAKAPDAPKASSTIRVDHEKLDQLMNQISELIIIRNRYSMLARQLEDNHNVDNSEVAQSLSETTYSLARISDDLQDTIMKVRMVPVSTVFTRFPRLVRDLSRKSGKDVELIMEGEETELDKSVVEVIGDPLVHLIRNSMDHGVELAEDRIAVGKPAQGKVWLRAFHRGNSVAIEIEDDGKGIDPVKMRAVAVKKGLMTAEEANQLDDHEAIELIFAPGFSSAEKITDISGRGVGMDVVRTNIKNLKGSVSISSEINKGTRITLSLPLTLAIIDALMIEIAGDMYAIPLDSVSETTKIESARLTDVKGRKAVTLRGEVLGIMDLCGLLGMPSGDMDREVLSVVVIHDNGRRLGLVVDRLQERQEIVIKPLGEYLGNIDGISGATILGDGSVILILDPHEIYLLATSKGVAQ